MSIIYLVRHGQSEANKKRIWGGDMPLSELGKEQALTVPGKIDMVPEKVVSSNLQRANMTARIAYPDYDVEKNGAFDEIRFGEQNEVPMTEETLNHYHSDPEDFFAKYHADDLRERSAEAVEEIIKYAKQYDKLVIFTSDTLMRNIVTFIQGKRPNESRYYYIKNCEVISFTYDGELRTDNLDSMVKVR